MTLEEATEAWGAEEGRQYVLGREQAAAILAAIPVPERQAPEETAAELAETEQRAQAMAAQLVRQANAAHAAEQARKPAAAGNAVVTVTDLPGAPLGTERQREMALAHAMQIAPPLLRPGDEVADFVVRVGDEAKVVSRSSAPVMTLIRPDAWDEYDRQWRAQRRASENALLVKVYGEKVCSQAGIVP